MMSSYYIDSSVAPWVSPEEMNNSSGAGMAEMISSSSPETKIKKKSRRKRKKDRECCDGEGEHVDREGGAPRRRNSYPENYPQKFHRKKDIDEDSNSLELDAHDRGLHHGSKQGSSKHRSKQGSSKHRIEIDDHKMKMSHTSTRHDRYDSHDLQMIEVRDQNAFSLWSYSSLYYMGVFLFAVLCGALIIVIGFSSSDSLSLSNLIDGIFNFSDTKSSSSDDRAKANSVISSESGMMNGDTGATQKAMMVMQFSRSTDLESQRLVENYNEQLRMKLRKSAEKSTVDLTVRESDFATGDNSGDNVGSGDDNKVDATRDKLALQTQGSFSSISGTSISTLSQSEITQMQTELRNIKTQIETAIRIGAPMYNNGDHCGCRSTYETTRQNILRDIALMKDGNKLIPEDVKKWLEGVELVGAGSNPTGDACTDDAWALRRAFDAVLALEEPEYIGEKTATGTNNGANNEAKKITNNDDKRVSSTASTTQTETTRIAANGANNGASNFVYAMSLRTIKDAIDFAIRFGAPIYNDGNHCACADIYDSTRMQILYAPTTSSGGGGGGSSSGNSGNTGSTGAGISSGTSGNTGSTGGISSGNTVIESRFGNILPKAVIDRFENCSKKLTGACVNDAWELRYAFDDIVAMTEGDSGAMVSFNGGLSSTLTSSTAGGSSSISRVDSSSTSTSIVRDDKSSSSFTSVGSGTASVGAVSVPSPGVGVGGGGQQPGSSNAVASTGTTSDNAVATSSGQVSSGTNSGSGTASVLSSSGSSSTGATGSSTSNNNAGGSGGRGGSTTSNNAGGRGGSTTSNSVVSTSNSVVSTSNSVVSTNNNAVSSTSVSSSSSTSTLSVSSIKDSIRTSINTGVPQFNSGDPCGCKETYETTRQEILNNELPIPIKVKTRLQEVTLKGGSLSSDCVADAWTLRYAFNDVLGMDETSAGGSTSSSSSARGSTSSSSGTVSSSTSVNSNTNPTSTPTSAPNPSNSNPTPTPLSPQPTSQPTTSPLTRFSLSPMSITNDGVMGGLSSSSWSTNSDGSFTFSGTVRTENRGGFASARWYPSWGTAANLIPSSSSGLYVRAKKAGGTTGHTFELMVDIRNQGQFTAKFTPNNQYQTFKFGFDESWATQAWTWRRSSLRAATFNRQDVQMIGIMAIKPNVLGGFGVRIEEVGAY